MNKRALAIRYLPAGGLMAAIALLGGCFLAEDDDANPIIPDNALAYPLKFGDGRECEEQEDGELSCQRASFERLAGGGYSITVYQEVTTDEDGEQSGESGTTSSEYKLRALRGSGVPADTYLVQTVSASERERFLGLLKRSSRGGWLKISPNCDKLSPEAFVRFMNQGWLHTDEGATLDSLTCHIVRDGLDDARLYNILSSTKSSGDSKILFSGG